jgi:Ca2+-binding EF-hand superfamily protein
MEYEKIKLSEDKLEEVQRIFNDFDKNKDGTISVSELEEALKKLGCRTKENELNELLKEFDKDDSGFLDYKEFCQIVSAQTTDSSSDEFLAEALRAIDTNGDGIIPCSDLISLLTAVGPRLSMEEVEEIIKEIDPKNEGFIRYEDLLKNKSVK